MERGTLTDMGKFELYIKTALQQHMGDAFKRVKVTLENHEVRVHYLRKEDKTKLDKFEIRLRKAADQRIASVSVPQDEYLGFFTGNPVLLLKALEENDPIVFHKALESVARQP